MLKFSTDDVAVHERFAHWREIRAKNIFGVTVELEKERQVQFTGEFSAIPIGDATLIEMHSASYHVTRSWTDIANASGDSFCIYQQLQGESWFETDAGEFTVTTGALATIFSDLPYRAAPTNDGGFHLRLLKIPFARCKSMIEINKDLPAQLLVAAEPGLAALLSSYFSAFVVQAPHLGGTGADMAVQTLAQLALVARGLAGAEGQQGQAAVRASRLRMAREIIEKNLSSDVLSPAETAGALGISVRQLQLLFEEAGTSYARYILSRRLERVRMLLGQPGSASISEIATACGFSSMATFHRNFKTAYGISPSGFRESVTLTGCYGNADAVSSTSTPTENPT
jgi:AraC-like DNA-binding protein